MVSSVIYLHSGLTWSAVLPSCRFPSSFIYPDMQQKRHTVLGIGFGTGLKLCMKTIHSCHSSFFNFWDRLWWHLVSNRPAVISKIKFLFMLCWAGIYSPFKNYRLGALATSADNKSYWLTTEMVVTSSTSAREHENVTFNYMVWMSWLNVKGKQQVQLHQLLI